MCVHVCVCAHARVVLVHVYAHAHRNKRTALDVLPRHCALCFWDSVSCWHGSHFSLLDWPVVPRDPHASASASVALGL